MRPDFLLKTRRQAIARARRKYHVKDYQGALTEWDDLLTRNDDDALAMLGRFDCLLKLGEKDEVLAVGESVCEANPESQATHNNFACILLERGEYAKAAEYFSRVIAMDDSRSMYYFNAGLAYRGSGEPDKAAVCFSRVLKDEPEHQRALEFLSQIYLDAGLNREAVEFSMRLRLLRPGYTLPLERRAYARWADDELDDQERSLEAAVLRNALAPKETPLPGGKITIGFMVCSYGLEILRYVMPLLLRYRDPGQVELLGFTNDTMLGAASLEGLFDRVESCDSANPERMRGMLAINPVDILVDVAGLVPNQFGLCYARRLAPRQVAWPLTYTRAELTFMDRALVDDQVVSKTEVTESVCSSLGVRALSDHVHRLETLLCYPESINSAEPSESPASRNGFITFGVNADLNKINDASIRDWCEILQRSEGARLKFIAPGLPSTLAEPAITGKFADAGIDPARISFEGALEFDDRLTPYIDVDIVLNPNPFGETLRLADAMWMGCPVLGVADDRHVARLSNSVLKAAGKHHWCYENRAGMIEAAVAMAADMPALARIRAGLRDELRGSTLMKAETWVGAFFEALLG